MLHKLCCLRSEDTKKGSDNTHIHRSHMEGSPPSVIIRDRDFGWVWGNGTLPYLIPMSITLQKHMEPLWVWLRWYVVLVYLFGHSSTSLVTPLTVSRNFPFKEPSFVQL